MESAVLTYRSSKIIKLMKVISNETCEVILSPSIKFLIHHVHIRNKSFIRNYPIPLAVGKQGEIKRINWEKKWWLTTLSARTCSPL